MHTAESMTAAAIEKTWDKAIDGCAAIINGISLKKFKHLPSLSDETECFTADVYWNGKLVACASNHGHGGNTDIHFTDAVARVAMVNAVADALTAAGIPADFFGFEAIVDTAVAAELDRRHVEKQRKAFAKKCHALGFHMVCLADDRMISLRGPDPSSLTAWKGIQIVAVFPLPTE